ncbi:MAG TPA: nucleotidyltransferase family protein [Xanthomonadales bacterium]|nr:nucleotidyltransferase family protein [Xanthomonadales bacterium]
MHALVLAAGAGSRLRRYTADRPKPLLEIFGEPILGYNLAMLAAAGFDDVVVNLHAFPDAVRDYAGDGSRWGLRVTYSEEPELRGTAGALVPLAQAFAGEAFAIVFGDNLGELDLADMLACHRERGALATIAVWERADVTQSGVAEIGGGDRIVRFVEKPASGETASHWVNAGVVIAEPALLDVIPRDCPSDLGRDVFPALAAGPRGLSAYRMTGGHWWFDRVEDYEAAHSDERLAAFARRARPARR